jgi:heterodisulfide reductase subunit B
VTDRSETGRQSSESRYALYLGCTVPVRGMNYEMAARRVAERLGVTLVDVEHY